jgi:hypothetical protein
MAVAGFFAVLIVWATIEHFINNWRDRRNTKDHS